VCSEKESRGSLSFVWRACRREFLGTLKPFCPTTSTHLWEAGDYKTHTRCTASGSIVFGLLARQRQSKKPPHLHLPTQKFLLFLRLKTATTHTSYPRLNCALPPHPHHRREAAAAAVVAMAVAARRDAASRRTPLLLFLAFAFAVVYTSQRSSSSSSSSSSDDNAGGASSFLHATRRGKYLCWTAFPFLALFLFH
jgi:hypothetical protein